MLTLSQLKISQGFIFQVQVFFNPFLLISFLERLSSSQNEGPYLQRTRTISEAYTTVVSFCTLYRELLVYRMEKRPAEVTSLSINIFCPRNNYFLPVYADCTDIKVAVVKDSCKSISVLSSLYGLDQFK